MDRAELSWRAAAAARIAAGRLHVRVVAPAWDRGTLLSVLTPSTELSAVRDRSLPHSGRRPSTRSPCISRRRHSGF